MNGANFGNSKQNGPKNKKINKVNSYEAIIVTFKHCEDLEIAPLVKAFFKDHADHVSFQTGFRTFFLLLQERMTMKLRVKSERKMFLPKGQASKRKQKVSFE